MQNQLHDCYFNIFGCTFVVLFSKPIINELYAFGINL